MKLQLRRFLDFDCGDHSAVLVNNYEWMGNFGYLEFLRDVGKHFPVNIMLSKDSVRSRLDRTSSGLSYTEFSYMLLQAFDFVYLNDRYGCEIQAGGSDQWGNITAGIDLARRLRGVQLFGCTCPLLTRSDGVKMGKTESGALWLSPYKTEPRDFYNYWINVDDADVGRCLRFFSDMPQEALEDLLAQHERDPGQRLAQRTLAAELTDLVHGAADREKIENGSRVIYAQSENRLDMISKASNDMVPTMKMARDRLAGGGLSIISAFVEAGLCRTKSEARRIITQGGAYVNDDRIDDIELHLTHDHLYNQSMILLRSGKKNHMRLLFR